MMRLPWFEFRAPATVQEAARILAGEGPNAMLIAGGTDLLPNMKRRQMAPKILVSLRKIASLKANGQSIGSGTTLTEVIRTKDLPRGLRQAAHQVATVHLRNMGTLGGNLGLDTRCNYYNQSYEWRKAIDFCMKKDGAICWVAPSSPRCWAVSSSDVAPVMVAIGAEYRLVGDKGERLVPAGRFYQNDGIKYLTKQPDEILVDVRPSAAHGWAAVYHQLPRRSAV